MSPSNGEKPAAALECTDVSVRFGGVEALKRVSLRVEPGEIVGLIGGNGAGKTTFMDCVSGYVRPEPGARIAVLGEPVEGLAPELRSHLGMVRSFQEARLYPGLSVDETLLIACERYRPSGLFPALFDLGSAKRAEADKRDRIEELIDSLGLATYREKLVRELSTGTRRVVELATTLAQAPKLILLDEPTTGLAQRETEEFAPLLRWVREQLDCSILIIEHDMPLITSLADRLYAFEAGEVIAEGSPRDVTADPRVVASYLGTDEAAIRRSGRAAKRGSAGTAKRRRPRTQKRRK